MKKALTQTPRSAWIFETYLSPVPEFRKGAQFVQLLRQWAQNGKTPKGWKSPMSLAEVEGAVALWEEKWKGQGRSLATAFAKSLGEEASSSAKSQEGEGSPGLPQKGDEEIK